MKNWILGISLAANIFLVAMLFFTIQYSKKTYYLLTAMTTLVELRVNEHLHDLITSNRIDEAKAFLNNSVKTGTLAVKTTTEIARWYKLPYTPQHIRDMENTLTAAEVNIIWSTNDF